MFDKEQLDEIRQARVDWERRQAKALGGRASDPRGRDGIPWSRTASTRPHSSTRRASTTP
jgi:hypothetical protein